MIPDYYAQADNISSGEEFPTIKKKPPGAFCYTAGSKKNSSNHLNSSEERKMSLTESDFINQALVGAGGKISRSNSSNALAKSSSSTDVSSSMIYWYIQ